MERCPHCGAATRPGAKFCTSCGTRLDDQPATTPAESRWSDTPAPEETQVSTPAITADDVAQESESVTPEPDWAKVVPDVEGEDGGAGETSSTTTWSSDAPETDEGETTGDSVDSPANESSGWDSKWPDTTSSASAADTSPADRFKDALTTEDTEAEAANDSDDSTANEPAFPERNVWSWGAQSDEHTTDESPASGNENADDSAWKPSSSTGDETSGVVDVSETIVPEPDTAGFSEAGQVDHLSGDESLATDETSANAGAMATTSTDDAGEDARRQANALLDELRGMIWKIGEDESPTDGHHPSIISNMKRVRGATSDFSDLERIIAAVQENPRDIDALRGLGQQADRLQELLDSHAALTATLEDAIRQGNR